MNTSALTIGHSHEGGVCVVTLSGRIDSTNANDLMSRLNASISSWRKVHRSRLRRGLVPDERGVSRFAGCYR